MFCPKCGQEKVSPDTNFCSRCGFLLSGTAELLQTGGVLPQQAVRVGKSISPRSRGIRQGIFIFLLTFLVAPIVGLISVALDIEPFGVGIAGMLLFFGGLLRIAWAYMFEEASPRQDDFLVAAQTHMNRPADLHALPPQQSYPVEQYVKPVGNRRETSDLEPRSITEGTTKLLEEERDR